MNLLTLLVVETRRFTPDLQEVRGFNNSAFRNRCDLNLSFLQPHNNSRLAVRIVENDDRNDYKHPRPFKDAVSTEILAKT